jgi:hypothetical protein
MRCCRQDDVVGLNAGELFQDRARGVSEAGAALPHLQALPQNEGEEANQDVSLDAILALMPDRTRMWSSSFWMRKAASAWVSWM